jgi:exodeoxyribonuclease X
MAECQGHDVFDESALFLTPCAAVAAHNSDFETKFFASPVPVICTYKAALRVWPEAPGHSNGTLRYWLEDAGKIKPDHALTLPTHRAGPDAYVTAHVLLALFEAGATGKQMVAWTKEPRLLPTCPIGKFRGKPWPDVEAGFLGWMLRQPTMEADLKWNAQREIERREGAIT